MWVGSEQAERLQRELSICLGRHDIEYVPVTSEPGSVNAVVRVPPPPEWWANEIGYGILGGDRVSSELDPAYTDPNERLRSTPQAERRLLIALFGPSGDIDRFEKTACYAVALRRSQFFQEERAGTGLLNDIDLRALTRVRRWLRQGRPSRGA